MKLEKCLYYYTHHEKHGRVGFGLRRFDCERCDGLDENCRLYESVKNDFHHHKYLKNWENR